VLLGALATGFSERITDNPDVPAAARETIVAKADKGIDIVPGDAVEQAAVDGGLTQDQARAVAADYGDAQLDALRLALGAGGARCTAVAVVHAGAADGGARRGRRTRRGARDDRLGAQWTSALNAISTPPMTPTARACRSETQRPAPASRPARKP
jgi:hypothetical protein